MEERTPIFFTRNIPYSDDEQEFGENTEDINDFLYKKEIEQLIKGNFRPTNEFEEQFLLEYSKTFGFIKAMYSDPKFNILTKPKSIFRDNCLISFEIEFNFDTFNIKNCKTTEVEVFEYANRNFELLECIQNGLINIDVLHIFKVLETKYWINGKVLISIVDNRLTPEKYFTFLLQINEEIYYNYVKSQKLAADQEKLLESKVLLMRHPIICTDPSPNVCRIKSLLDNQKKMWLTQGNSAERSESKKEGEFCAQKVARKSPKVNKVEFATSKKLKISASKDNIVLFTKSKQ